MNGEMNEEWRKIETNIENRKNGQKFMKKK